MDLHKISVKLFADAAPATPDAVIPVFHHWIQNQSLPNHLLIDVADYAHVVDGPGTILITSEANIHFEKIEGRLGLTYFRKLPIEGSLTQKLKSIIAEALIVAAALEKEPELSGKLKFSGSELLIRFNDRLLAPSNDETLKTTRPQVESVANALYGAGNFAIEGKAEALELPQFLIQAKGSPTLESLRGTLEANAPVAAGK